MKVNSEIFRAYDIRGIVDEALTEEGIFQIGKAIGSYPSEGRTSILTARDGRISGLGFRPISKRRDVFRM